MDKTSVMFYLVLDGTMCTTIFLFSVVGRVLPDESKGRIPSSSGLTSLGLLNPENETQGT